MKNKCLLLIYLFSLFSYAQDKKIQFKESFFFKLESLNNNIYDSSKVIDNLEYTIYHSPLGYNLIEFISTEDTFSTSYFYITYDNKFYPLLISPFSRKASINYLWGQTETNNPLVTLEKTDKKGKFLGIECTYYNIIEKNSWTDKEEINTCLCIDEKNEINTVNAYYNTPVKGLLVALENQQQQFRIVLTERNKVDEYIYFDLEKEVASMSTNQTEIRDIDDINDEISDGNYLWLDSMIEDPLYYSNYYKFFNSEKTFLYENLFLTASNLLMLSKEYLGENAKYSRQQIVDYLTDNFASTSKNLLKNKIITKEENKNLHNSFESFIKEAKQYVVVPKSTEEIEETINFSDTYVEDVWNAVTYFSIYKNEKIEDISLAIDSFTEDYQWKAIPDYCKELEKKIPVFENQSLQKHVHNYLGQLCDLYAYHMGNVDYYATINSMRKSLLEIEKLRSSLSKKDTELLLQFINSLD